MFAPVAQLARQGPSRASLYSSPAQPMSWGFRRRIKVLPGVHLNVGKRGVSVSAGPRGLGITVGARRTTLHAGLPGTGLSATESLPRKAPAPGADANPGTDRRDLFVGIAFLAALIFVAWVINRLF